MKNKNTLRLLVALKYFAKELFSLDEDKADEKEIVYTIKKGVEFKGTNVWVLVFAIFIASIGLNVNSTAVIIGAMLISPLMGPIMGVGLGIGINDFELIKRAFKNLAIATLISVSTSALYFLISPLSEAQSELLARTTPTIWDVLIALFGGLAGIVAATRKSVFLLTEPVTLPPKRSMKAVASSRDIVGNVPVMTKVSPESNLEPADSGFFSREKLRPATLSFSMRALL